MSEPINKLERLARLKADGAITDDEFAVQKAAILTGASADNDRTDEVPSRSASKLMRVLVALGLFAALIAGAYLLARWHGSQDALAEASPPRSTTPPAGTGPAEEAATADSAGSTSPPADYLGLCIYASFQPLGVRLSTMADFILQQGRHVTWEASGADWILRMSWHDGLTDTDNEEAFEFQRHTGATAAPACDHGLGQLELVRIAQDGVEIHEFDPFFAPMLLNAVREATERKSAATPPVSPSTDEDTIRKVPVVARYIALNEQCRDGDDAAAVRACEQRDAMAPEVQQAGYCWGNPSSQSEAEKRWQRCAGE